MRNEFCALVDFTVSVYSSEKQLWFSGIESDIRHLCPLSISMKAKKKYVEIAQFLWILHLNLGNSTHQNATDAAGSLKRLPIIYLNQ